MSFPKVRMRRLRRSKGLRRLIAETTLNIEDLIFPLIVQKGGEPKTPIESMPGIYKYSLKGLVEEIKEVGNLDIPAVVLFGVPSKKDERGSEAFDDNGVIQEAVRVIKDINPEILVITDICLCEYTTHGHCGLIKNGEIDNDSTLEILCKVALSQARAGVDMVAPSDMMDGRVGKIRENLDKNGFNHVSIMSYAVKYASSFYYPFREAADSTPQFGDRKSYQMDPSNILEAIREVALDLEEGADIIMIKPAISYLDVIARIKEEFCCPIAAYNVSGEYAMIKGAHSLGFVDGDKVMMEVLLSIKRSGADMIVTYFAKDAARALKNGIK